MVRTLCEIAWPILNHALGGRTGIFIHSMGVVRIFFGSIFISNTHRVALLANSLLKVTYFLCLKVSTETDLILAIGYKVGRVEQAETALGAEMRMAAEKEQTKSKPKGKAASGAQDKIVRRQVPVLFIIPHILTFQLGH
jgi:hypothetical protein